MSDYLIKMRVYNGPLLRLMKQRGITNGRDLERRSGVPYGSIVNYLTLKAAPFKGGKWTRNVLTLAKFFNVIPEVMFPEQHIEKPLDKNYAEFEASLADIERITHEAELDPQRFIDQADAKKLLASALDTLQPKDRYALEQYHVNGRTMREISADLGVTQARVAQRITKAECKLKHPRTKLKFALDSLGMRDYVPAEKCTYYHRDNNPGLHYDAYMRAKDREASEERQRRIAAGIYNIKED